MYDKGSFSNEIFWEWYIVETGVSASVDELISVMKKTIFVEAIQSFPNILFIREAALLASELFRKQKKKGKIVGHQDCLIAGSYLSAGISCIVTKDKKHFNSFSEIKVVSY